MSLAHKTDVHQGQATTADRNPQSRGFLLALVCIAIFILLAHFMFPPVTGGGETAVWLIGP
jgi:hypothetical protein